MEVRLLSQELRLSKPQDGEYLQYYVTSIFSLLNEVTTDADSEVSSIRVR